MTEWLIHNEQTVDKNACKLLLGKILIAMQLKLSR